MLGPRATLIIASIVTAVWALNFLAGIVSSSYHPDQSINGIFMAVVGGLIALSGRNRDRRDNHHGRHERDDEWEE